MDKMPKKKSKCAAVNPSCSTINLAKDGHSLEDRKTKLLVYEKARYHPINRPKPECQLPVGLTLTPKTAKRIRICTAEDMRSTCPPPCCNCPRMRHPLTAGDMIKKGVKFGLKSVILFGVVYTTWDMGIWGTAEETECVWNSLKKVALGPEAEAGSPCVDRKLYGASEKWNYVISKTFLYLACFGRTIQSYISPGSEQICDLEERAKDNLEKAKKDPCTCK